MSTPVQWSHTRQTLPENLTDYAWNWLSRPYKLSEAFRRVATTLSVVVLSQAVSDILPDEAVYLKLEGRVKPFLRQAYISGDNNRFEYARVIVPPATYEKLFKQFDSLDANLIGEKMLYSHPGMKRSEFEYAAILSNDSRYMKALEGFSGEKPPILWARRSLFWLDELPLSVMEIFLPGIPDFKAEN
jgi:chorismate lyase